MAIGAQISDMLKLVISEGMIWSSPAQSSG
jgi:hypothetical protein